MYVRTANIQQWSVCTQTLLPTQQCSTERSNKGLVVNQKCIISMMHYRTGEHGQYKPTEFVYSRDSKPLYSLPSTFVSLVLLLCINESTSDYRLIGIFKTTYK